MSKILQDGVARLFNSSEHSDVIIRCGTREWPAHRLVLVLQSDFFNKALKKGGFLESISGVIELHDDNPDIFQIVLQALYEINYRATHRNTFGNPEFHVSVFRLADKYGIESLMNEAAVCFSDNFFTGDSLDNSTRAINMIYDVPSTSSKHLRAALMLQIAKYRKDLTRGSGPWSVWFEEQLREGPQDFAADVALKFGSQTCQERQ